MLQGEKVGDFYDKINILLDGARNSLREIDAHHINYMMFHLESRAVDIFIKGLPIDIAKAVDALLTSTPLIVRLSVWRCE